MAARSSINLLPKEYQSPVSLQILGKTSFLILGVYIFLLVLISAGFFYFWAEEKKYTSQNETLSREIQTDKEKEGLLITIKNRAEISKLVFSKSLSSPSQELNNILALFPASVLLTQMSASDNGEIIVTGTAPSSEVVANFFRTLKEKQTKSVYLNTLNLKETGGYFFALTIK